MSKTRDVMGTRRVSLKPVVCPLLLLCTLTAATDLTAQQQCRYRDLIFNQVDMVTNVTYATNIWNPTTETNDTLRLDLCKPPATDTAPKRPVMIYFHGGKFEGGGKGDVDAQFFCQQFAKAGYVGITAEYRLACSDENVCPGCDVNPDLCEEEANTYRARSDMGAVVRWVRCGSGSTNPHRFDKDLIFVAGFSAGGITGNSFAYDNRFVLPGDNSAWYSSTCFNHSVSGTFTLDGTIDPDFVDSDSTGIHMQFLSTNPPDDDTELVKCNLPEQTDFNISVEAHAYVNKLIEYLDADQAGHVNLTCFDVTHLGLADCNAQPHPNTCESERNETLLFFYNQIFAPTCEPPPAAHPHF